jgi:hypothetical protein
MNGLINIFSFYKKEKINKTAFATMMLCKAEAGIRKMIIEKRIIDSFDHD